MTHNTALTTTSTVDAWLKHPIGGDLLRDLLAKGGQTEAALAPARQLSMSDLIKMSGGAIASTVIDEFVRQANDGTVPDQASDDATSSGWAEIITPGRFNGKTVIVTGAGSGIGRATASRIAREGGRVIGVDISQERLDDVAKDLSEHSFVAISSDLTQMTAIGEVLNTAGDRIDGLANVAGIMDTMTAIHEVTDAMWERVFAVNVNALFRLTRAVVPHMLERGQGSVVNVASEAALRGSAAGLTYTASKHAVVGITRSCAFMYGPDGLRFNAVAPGPVATSISVSTTPGPYRDRLATGGTAMPPVAGPAQLAATISFLLSDDGTNLNGAILPADGGWSVA